MGSDLRDCMYRRYGGQLGQGRQNCTCIMLLTSKQL